MDGMKQGWKKWRKPVTGYGSYEMISLLLTNSKYALNFFMWTSGSETFFLVWNNVKMVEEQMT